MDRYRYPPMKKAITSHSWKRNPVLPGELGQDELDEFLGIYTGG